MKMASLHDLFIIEVQDLYDAERQLVEALPKMAKAANHPDLQAGFEDHLEETKGHVDRLAEIAKTLGFELKGKSCKGMEGLIKEGEEIIKNSDESLIRDLALISAAQKVEHYEVSGYGTARTLAEAMDHDEAVELLEETKDEEEAADEKLTEIADQIMSEMENNEM
jgi:ferritin-like metal-binding protein YciE